MGPRATGDQKAKGLRTLFDECAKNETMIRDWVLKARQVKKDHVEESKQNVTTGAQASRM